MIAQAPVARTRSRTRRLLLLLVAAHLATAHESVIAERHYSGMPPMVKMAGAHERLQLQDAEATLVSLGPVEVAPAATNQSDTRIRVGQVRELEATAAKWRRVDKGHAAQWRVRASGAVALRVQLGAVTPTAGLRLRIAAAGQSEGQVEPVPATLEFWSAPVSGEEAVVEVFAPPGAVPPELTLRRIVHHHTDPISPPQAKSAWNAQPCQRDVACTSDPAVARASSASIKISWVEGYAAYACSATLLNPADGSFQPYVMTAEHCVGSQAAADTVVAHWFYEKSTCGGAETRPDAVRTGGGADLLAVDAKLDASFMRLRRPPPPGVTYAGWDSAPLAIGDRIVALHHANGEVTKLSRGTVGPRPPYDFEAVYWEEGIAQGGSSGSGAFTADPARADLLFRGNLSGTRSSCQDPGFAVYSRLDLFWPKVAPYLSAAPAHTNLTGLWWNPAEPGWGISMSQQGDAVFAVLFTYDDNSRPMWLVASGMRRTSSHAFAGTLHRTRLARPGDMASAQLEDVGEILISIHGRNDARIQYTFRGMPITKAITRQVFGASVPVCSAAKVDLRHARNLQGLWWEPGSPGWGIGIAHQGDLLFATIFTYGDDGESTWFVAPALQHAGTGSYGGTLYRTQGRNPASSAGPDLAVFAEGPMQLSFPDGNNGRLEASTSGRKMTRALTRQIFNEPSACN